MMIQQMVRRGGHTAAHRSFKRWESENKENMRLMRKLASDDKDNGEDSNDEDYDPDNDSVDDNTNEDDGEEELEEYHSGALSAFLNPQP